MNRRQPRERLKFITVATAVAVGIVILVGFGPPGLLLSRATACELGAKVGTFIVWTPEILLNKPAGAIVSQSNALGDWNYTMSSGSLTFGTLPTPRVDSGFQEDFNATGGFLGEFSDLNWTFYRTTNQTVVGSSGAPCTQPFLAIAGTSWCGGGGSGIVPLTPNGSNDSQEPHVEENLSELRGSACPQETPGSFVWFDTSYQANGTGTDRPVEWDLCNQSNGTLQLVGPAQIPINVTVPFEGHDISSQGFLSWQGSVSGGSVGPLPGGFDSATWLIPGGSKWSLSPVGPAAFSIDPNAPLPGLVAFEERAC